MKQKILMLITLLLLGVGTALGQTITAKGRVVDENNDGAPTATVRLKSDAKKGTFTDMNGNFVLEAKQGEIIVISFVGYKTLELPAKADMGTIKLEPDNEVLQEVMVVAFGTQKKAAFTGSAAVIDSKSLDKHVATNVANALVGTVPGLQMRGGSGQPGSDAGAMNVRGVTSINAGTEPLIIVDGAPYPASMSNIPQSDIESVTVLKDAASAALYGARGASGVILVTTKKGNKSDARISLDMKWGMNTRSVQEYDKITDPGAYYEAVYAQFANYFTSTNMYDAAEVNKRANRNMNNFLVYNVFTLPENEQLVGIDGKLNPNATVGRTYNHDGVNYYLQPDDWTSMSYKPALRQEYNVNVTGGTEKSSFFGSVGYLDEKGVIEYSGFKRFSARVKADYNARSWMKVGANINYVNSQTTSNPNLSADLGSTNLMYFTSMMAPIYPVYVRIKDKDGNVVIRQDEFGNEEYDFGSNYRGQKQRPFSAPGNPLGNNRYNQVLSQGNQLNATGTLDLTFTDYLKFNATSTVLWGATLLSNYQNGLYGPKAGVRGWLRKSSTDSYRTNHVQTLTFFKDFDKHYLNAMIGHEYYNVNSKFLFAEAQGGFSPYIKELSAFAKKTDNGSYTAGYNVEGFFANIQYDYDNKYFGSMSFRRDASSRFYEKNRWGNFWSIGGAWLMSQENFIKQATWIDLLKLKFSIGQQGNDNIRDYAYTDTYSLTPSSEVAMSPTFRMLGNEKISWETTTNTNIGLEFGFWKNRLTGNLDLYTKKTSGMLFWMSIPESGGSRGYYDNVGDIRNTGVELNITGVPVRTKNLEWSISLNTSHNVSKILSLPADKIENGGGYYADGLWYRIGGPMYNYMTYVYAGVNENGEATYYYDDDLRTKTDTGYNANNSIPGKQKSGVTTIRDEASRYELGTNLPDLFGGFGTSLVVGNFDMHLQFDYQIGGRIFDSQYATLMTPMRNSQSAGQVYHKDWMKSWTPTNKTDVPRWQYGDKYTSAGSDRFLTSASYLNFQSFTIGYTLPKNLISGVSSIRVYAAGENLMFWSARKGLDPRFSFSDTNTVGAYSPVRNISGGIQVTF